MNRNAFLKRLFPLLLCSVALSLGMQACDRNTETNQDTSTDTGDEETTDTGSNMDTDSSSENEDSETSVVDSDTGTNTGEDTDILIDTDTDWPLPPNAYSWDGSWNPTDAELPPDGLFDSIYFDGHAVEGNPSPILPPGEWDWEVTSLLANWRGFSTTVGTFSPLKNTSDLQFGWRLERAAEAGIEVNAVLQVFYGSSGPDILNFGPAGSFASAGNPLYGDPVNMGDSPDMFSYKTGYSAAARTGSSATGHERDNDLVLIGGSAVLPAGQFDIITTSIHAGPGRDLVFANNWERAGVDLGNGNDARTDTIDPYDGGDMVVIGGNARDFRVFGGNGDDVFVWRVDEVNQEPNTWLGPNFFGGGGWGEALWSDTGTDRLILDIPAQTPVVTAPSQLSAGKILVMVEGDYVPVIDTPTENDPCARYYITAPEGPQGQKTMTVQYMSQDSGVNTAYFYLTAIEELQLGTASDALVYSLDPIAGTATLNATLLPKLTIPVRAAYEQLMETFLQKK